MKLLMPFIALVLLVYVLMAEAANVFLTLNDFASAKESKKNGEIVVLAELSKSGNSKLKSLNHKVGEEIEVKLAGETHKLKLREPIHDGKLQFGPFGAETAEKIVKEINSK